MSASTERAVCPKHPGGYFGSGCPRCGRRDLAWERASRGWRPPTKDAAPNALPEAAPASIRQVDLSPQNSTGGQRDLFI